jgi:hypothetical protein
MRVQYFCCEKWAKLEMGSRYTESHEFALDSGGSNEGF